MCRGILMSYWMVARNKLVLLELMAQRKLGACLDNLIVLVSSRARD